MTQGTGTQRMGQIETLKKANFSVLSNERQTAAGLPTDVLMRAGAVVGDLLLLDEKLLNVKSRLVVNLDIK